MPEEAPRNLPEHVTTPLLALITARSMDEDYAHVAAKRQAEEGDPTPSRPRWITVALVAGVGVLAAVVAAQTDRDSELTEMGRTAVLGQVNIERDRLADLQRQVRTLEDENGAALQRSSALGEQLDDLNATVTRLEVGTGFGPVRGPGVRLTVDSAPGADPNKEVRDEDLALLVDALWEAGAEAIAIGDQRLTAMTGIRNTNRAIHVNGVPVSAPYVITAIGDSSSLQADLLRTSQGQEWFALVSGLQFRYTPENVDDLRLPGATLPPLRDVIVASQVPRGQDKEGSP